MPDLLCEGVALALEAVFEDVPVVPDRGMVVVDPLLVMVVLSGAAVVLAVVVALQEDSCDSDYD